jgi:hypothetical protein
MIFNVKRKMKKVPLLIFTLILVEFCPAQFKTATLDLNSIPANIKFKGKPVYAVRWTDSTGENLVVLSRLITESLNQGSNGNLFAYNFNILNNTTVEKWVVKDHIEDCGVDMFLKFLENKVSITDLDKDGKAEVWMIYKVSCQGDVSPVPMKIIMYEDGQKFAARGDTRVQFSAKDFMGGSYSFDAAFKKGPAVFRTYADKLWLKHKVEKWDQ